MLPSLSFYSCFLHYIFEIYALRSSGKRISFKILRESNKTGIFTFKEAISVGTEWFNNLRIISISMGRALIMSAIDVLRKFVLCFSLLWFLSKSSQLWWCNENNFLSACLVFVYMRATYFLFSVNLVSTTLLKVFISNGSSFVEFMHTIIWFVNYDALTFSFLICITLMSIVISVQLELESRWNSILCIG